MFEKRFSSLFPDGEIMQRERFADMNKNLQVLITLGKHRADLGVLTGRISLT